MNYDQTNLNAVGVELQIELDKPHAQNKKLTIKERLEKINAIQNRAKAKSRNLKLKQKKMDAKRKNEINSLIFQMLEKQNPELLSEFTKVIFSRRPLLRP